MARATDGGSASGGHDEAAGVGGCAQQLQASPTDPSGRLDRVPPTAGSQPRRRQRGREHSRQGSPGQPLHLNTVHQSRRAGALPLRAARPVPPLGIHILPLRGALPVRTRRPAPPLGIHPLARHSKAAPLVVAHDARDETHQLPHRLLQRARSARGRRSPQGPCPSRDGVQQRMVQVAPDGQGRVEPRVDEHRTELGLGGGAHAGAQAAGVRPAGGWPDVRATTGHVRVNLARSHVEQQPAPPEIGRGVTVGGGGAGGGGPEVLRVVRAGAAERAKRGTRGRDWGGRMIGRGGGGEGCGGVGGGGVGGGGGSGAQ
eukprot:scaffold35355_cov101-Isochrysis_galbana.AAC.4